MKLRVGLAIAGVIFTLGLASATAATTPLLTDSLTAGSAIQTKFLGQTAVNVNFTNMLQASFTPAIVYQDVQNAAGQTVGFFVATASVGPGGVAPVYLVVFGLTPGHYTGLVFAATSTDVPKSTVSTISMTL